MLSGRHREEERRHNQKDWRVVCVALRFTTLGTTHQVVKHFATKPKIGPFVLIIKLNINARRAAAFLGGDVHYYIFSIGRLCDGIIVDYWSTDKCVVNKYIKAVSFQRARRLTSHDSWSHLLASDAQIATSSPCQKLYT